MAAHLSSEPKRKRAEVNGVIYSQPADTGTGKHVQTRTHFSLDYMKEKDRPVLFKDIFNFLSVPNPTEQDRRDLEARLKVHPLVEYDPQGFNGKGSFRFRPKHGVRSKEELEAFLQRQTTAQGIPVSELKEGWPGAITAIEELAKEDKLLMTRHKKEQTPKSVWPNDPSLQVHVDSEFQTLYHEVKMPANANDLRKELMDFGLQPTSQVKAPVQVKEKEKKKRASRRGGKTTNTHMQGILKDYSHLRRG